MASLLVPWCGASLLLSASADASLAGPSVAYLGTRFINDNAEYEPTTEAETARLGKLEELFKSKLAQSGRFSIVPVPPDVRARVAAAQPLGTCAGCEFEFGKALGADEVAWVSVHKVSNLVLSMTVILADVRSQRPVFAKAFDLRSNTDESWLRSINYVLKYYLLAEAGAHAAAAPLRKMAVFEFELEDFTAAKEAGSAPDETKYLAQSTEEAKRLLAQSGRYQVIDTAVSAGEVARAGGLRNCRGCESALALKLGADEALLGVVTKISMTEFTMRLKVTDARTGAVTAQYQTDLRMGADYAWSRAVASLIKNRMLASERKGE